MTAAEMIAIAAVAISVIGPCVGAAIFYERRVAQLEIKIDRNHDDVIAVKGDIQEIREMFLKML